MRTNRKYTSSALTAVMLLSALLTMSCGQTENELPSESGSSETTAPQVVYTDMGGWEFTVNVRGENTGNGYFACTDFQAEDMTGEPINDAVYERNRLIEDRYKCRIVQKYASGDQFDEISKGVMAGDPTEAGIVLGTSAAKLAQNGMLIDIGSLDGIDLSKDCWDQNASSAFNISGKIYFVTGDMNLSTNDSTRVTIFSKGIVENSRLDDPYELVRDGKWTINKMLELAVSANQDLNGDTRLTADDQVGLYVYNWAPQFFFYGCGERITTNSNDQIPELTLYNERSAEAVELIWQVCNASRTDTLGGFSSDQFNLFFSDRCLFTQTSVSDVRNTFRTNCEKDFGILPMPKLNEEQERYYNLVSFQDVTHIWCIPVSCSNEEYAGILLEAFAEESSDTVRKAYYNTTLQGKVSRDNDSAEMLDLIFDSRVYDLCLLFNWGSWDSYFTSMRNQSSNTFASTYESSKDLTIADIESTIEAFTANES